MKKQLLLITGLMFGTLAMAQPKPPAPHMPPPAVLVKPAPPIHHGAFPPVAPPPMHHGAMPPPPHMGHHQDFVKVNLKKIGRGEYQVVQGLKGYSKKVPVVLKTERNCAIGNGIANVFLERNNKEGTIVNRFNDCDIRDTKGLVEEKRHMPPPPPPHHAPPHKR